MANRPSSNMAAFREKLKASKHLVVLTGAGVSAESGVPTFRGAGGYWRTYKAQDLACPEAFQENPSLDTKGVIELHGSLFKTRCTKCGNIEVNKDSPICEALRDKEKADTELDGCDLCLVVGTSSVVYPAAMFAPQVASRGVSVAEFNLETTPATQQLGGHGFFFSGPCGQSLPTALAPF